MSGDPIAGAATAVARLREAGHRLRFVTNTTTRTRATLARELRELGFELAEEELETAAGAVARALRGKRPADDRDNGEDNAEEEIGGHSAGYEENEPLET